MNELAVTSAAIQDQLPDQPCWGCGQANAHGLRIKSHWSGEQSVCTWRPQPEHVGWPGVLNGGILAALVDCHCVCTAVADAYHAEGRALNSQPPVGFATGTLNVVYLKPVPIDAPVELYARIIERTARKTRLECVVVSCGEQRARADVVAVRLTVPLGSGA